MDPLAAALLEGLRQGRTDRALLATAGEPDPERAGRAFDRAVTDAQLAACPEEWAPELLLAARPGFGAESLVELVRGLRGRSSRPLPAGTLRSAARVLGSSNVLARLLVRHPELATELDGAPPAPPPSTPVPPDWEAIRSAKYRGLIRIVARDVAGRPLVESFRELSDLADRCLEAAFDRAARETSVNPPALFALGKLGGRELNFSSDVDLLLIYEAPSGAIDLERNQAVSRLVRLFKKNLETPASDGFGYRVDLDLRPEGARGVLANSVSAALDYYETFGAEWERQMLIRLRHLAGPADVAESFHTGIFPFVYRRAVGPEALQAVRAMKARIEDERRAQRRDLEADLKEGPGGIRDIEFFVQALQLFYGATHPELRSGHVVEALEALSGRGIVHPDTAQSLTEAYLWLRRAEHAVQWVEERQVHAFPREPREQQALARRMGYRDPEGARARERLLEDWTVVRSEVRGHFEALVLGGEQ